MRVLVYGLAIAGASTVRALQRRGHDVVVADDHIDDAKQDLANALGVELLPTPLDPGAFACQFDLIVPAPGVPETHDLVAAARRNGVPLASEIELGYRWEQGRSGGPRPILAVTGTDGKTTTTDMVVAMLRAAGHRAEAVGNTDVPFVDAVDTDLDVFVIECSSFRLAWTEHFRADAAAWLNFAPDHLNWHATLDGYEATKARIFDLQRSTDVAVGFIDDPVVSNHLRRAPGRQISFGLDRGDYRREGDELVGPSGPIGDVASMGRALPHDITNALAAAALVLETGLAEAPAIASALARFEAQPHRLESIAEADGSHLVQRLEGDHPSRCRHGDSSLRLTRPDRRWEPQGGRSVADGDRRRPRPSRGRDRRSRTRRASGLRADDHGGRGIEHGGRGRGCGRDRPTRRRRGALARMCQLRLVRRLPRARRRLPLARSPTPVDVVRRPGHPRRGLGMINQPFEKGGRRP